MSSSSDQNSEQANRILLEVRNLRLTLPARNSERRLLAENITFELPSGVILPLIGPSGSGKSTLLRSLIRFHPLETGHVYLTGQDVCTIPAPLLRTQLGFLAQTPVFSPGRVDETLLEPFAYRQVKQPKASTEELTDALCQVGLDDSFLEQQVDSLSGGEKQRLALARLLLLHPQILLLDEPTANLDEDSAEHILQRVRSWIAHGEHAAIWVSHSSLLTEKIQHEPYRLHPAMKQGEHHG